MIKEGTVCIWQNLTGPAARHNGDETTALSGLVFLNISRIGSDKMEFKLCYKTDTFDSRALARVAALSYQLREKYPPKDEDDIVTEKDLEAH